jgi:DNA-binding GntR family transcriptional regulator
LKPGNHLSIEQLAQALGISRTPVREALSRLEQEHTEIFQSLSEGNPKQAEILMHKHMKHTTNGLMIRLKDQNDIIHNAIAFDPKEWKKSNSRDK